MVLTWLEPAKDSLKAIADYYRQEYSVKSAKQIVSKIRLTVEKLKDFPQMGSVDILLEDEPVVYRSLVLTKTYKVVYYIDTDKIYISDIWDCRQAPENNVKNIKQ